MLKIFSLTAICLTIFVGTVLAQKEVPDKTDSQTAPAPSKKANQRPATTAPSEPYDKATVEMMKTKCVTLDTEAGSIDLELFPESAPETVRNFLNLTAIGAYDTTVFSRVVPDFIIQGGNLSTREKTTPQIAERSHRKLIDEPNMIRHERGILSMARSDEPNTATTHFFILLREALNLNATFAAFGRVTRGMDVVEAINKMPVVGEKPEKPVRLKTAKVVACPAPSPSPQ